MAALKRLHLSPWLIALLALGWMLEDGFPVQLLISLVCVLLHEMGHVLFAEQCGCETECVELTLFGGKACIAGMEQLSRAKRIGIALAGPAVNVLLVLLCSFGIQVMPVYSALLAEGSRCNAALLGFNLLPAYPMDGGRVLCALLEGRSGAVRAQRLTAVLGMAMGVAFAVLGMAARLIAGKFNLTLLLCGGYLCVEAHKAYRSTPFAYMTQLLGRKRALRKRDILPVRMLAVRNGTPDAHIAAKLRSGAIYRIVYLDEELRACGEKWETELEQ